MSLPAEERSAAVHAAHGNPDMRAAFLGLIVGTLSLLIIIYGIVRLTAAGFDDHAAPGVPAATTPH